MEKIYKFNLATQKQTHAWEIQKKSKLKVKSVQDYFLMFGLLKI